MIDKRILSFVNTIICLRVQDSTGTYLCVACRTVRRYYSACTIAVCAVNLRIIQVRLPYTILSYLVKSFLQEKAVEATKQNKDEKRTKPKHEEQEGMPQRQHCPPEQRRGDRNPECHEEQ
jgi:response regulator of citrate/malate metabolism